MTRYLLFGENNNAMAFPNVAFSAYGKTLRLLLMEISNSTIVAYKCANTAKTEQTIVTAKVVSPHNSAM